MTHQPYRDRRQAGRILAEMLASAPTGDDTLVLALPRGGVPVAEQVADMLDAPLDIFVVRKLGLPTQPELAMGAIASGGVRLLDDQLIERAEVTADEIDRVTEHEKRELTRRESQYRGGRPRVDPRGREVIVVDDGLATGFSMRAAIAALRKLECGRLTVAVPVGAPSSCEEISVEADLVICPLQPDPFHAVGLWYEDFMPTTEEEVEDCMAREMHRQTTGHHHRGGPR